MRQDNHRAALSWCKVEKESKNFIFSFLLATMKKAQPISQKFGQNLASYNICIKFHFATAKQNVFCHTSLR